MLCRWMLAILILPALAGLVRADEPKADPRAQEAVDKKLTELKAPKGELKHVSGDPLTKSFPKHSFFVLSYPQFPVARVPEEPLKANNLFVVDGDNKVELITDRKGLEKVFLAKAAVEGKTGTNDVLQSWMRLTQVFYQDGFYQFKIDKGGSGSSSSDGTEVQEGKVTVDPEGGNKGEIKVKLTFQKGKLTKIEEDGNVTPGMRPKCQATKLLDEDPIVRYMAEQSIVIMGSKCKSYLDEQRAKAGPELQKAIDRIWQRILDEGR